MSNPVEKITPKIVRFVDEYLVDLNGSAAATRAGYPANSARQRAYELLSSPAVCEIINERMRQRAERVRVTQDDVLRELVDVMRADAADITEYRRECCRYCYGEGNRYQRTAGEMERDRERHARENRQCIDEGKQPLDPFDEKGGIGWNPRRRPRPDCQECFGEGHGKLYLRDTRTLVGGARRLFDGIEETKEGLKARIRDRGKHAELVGRHLGMFNDKLQLTRPKVRIKDFTGRKKTQDADDE